MQYFIYSFKFYALKFICGLDAIIAKSLVTNRNLRRMNLKGNIIKSEGGKALRNWLFNSEGSSLVALNLYQNPVGAGIEQDIDDILRGNLRTDSLILDNKILNKKNLNTYKSQIVNLKHDRVELEKLKQSNNQFYSF